MKLLLKEDVRLGYTKSRHGILTAGVELIPKGQVFNIGEAILSHNKLQNVVLLAFVKWEKDGWKFNACFGTSHYPRHMWALIPETEFETCIAEPADMLR